MMSDRQKANFDDYGSIKQMLWIVFSGIIRKRRYYEKIYFFEHRFKGVDVHLLDWENPFVDDLIRKSINGAAASAELRYLSNVQMVFKLSNDLPDRFVERYAVIFTENDAFQLLSPITKLSLSPIIEKSWSSKSIENMNVVVDEVCRDLGDFPQANRESGGIKVIFRVGYNERCPKGYSAPHFERSFLRTLHFSTLLSTSPKHMPAPRRVLSDQSAIMRSSLAMQTLLHHAAHAPDVQDAAANDNLHVTHTDTSVVIPFRRHTERGRRSGSYQLLCIQMEEEEERGNEGDSEDNGRAGSDDDSDRQRGMTAGGDGESAEGAAITAPGSASDEVEVSRGVNSRKRSMEDEVEEWASKMSRSADTSLLSSRDKSRRLSWLSTSQDTKVHSERGSLTTISNDSPKCKHAENIDSNSPGIAEGLEHGTQEEEEGGEAHENGNETIDSDGGEPLFIQ